MTPPAAAATGGRTLPRTAAPRTARRVSGPAPKPKRGATAPARPGSAQTRTRPPRAAAPDPFVVRAIERTMKMADSKFLDRLIRGRLWIPLVAAGLMGIVFMQVSMLKLNAGIGRAVQASQTLERQNATMRAQVSGMEAGSKIDETATRLGMVAPSAQTTPSYVAAGGNAQATAAAKRMTAPDPEALARAKAATQAASALAAGTAATTTQTQTQAPVVQTQQAEAPVAQTQAPVAQTQTQQAAQTQAPVTQTQQAAPTQQTAPTQVAQTQAPVTQATAQPQQQATTATSTSGGAVAPAAG